MACRRAQERLPSFLRQRRQLLSMPFLLCAVMGALIPVRVWCAASNSSTPLHILYITSGGGEFVSSGTKPAVDMALERINNNPGVLHGYTLNITEGDSECNRKQALDEFFIHLFNPPHEVAVVGAGCSVASEALAEITPYYNLSVVSYASSSETLSNRELFPSFFRTVPSDARTVVGMVRVVEEFGWSRAAIITEDEKLFKAATEDLMVRLMGSNITVVSKVLLPTNASLISDTDLFAQDVRIFVLSMYSDHARAVICQAIKQNLDQYQYVWITPGWYLDRWWRDSSASFSISCGDEQLENFLLNQRVLAVSHYPTAMDENVEAVGGISPREFREEYTARVHTSGQAYIENAFYAYDAMWAVALALNNTIQRLPLGVSGGGAEGSGVPVVHVANGSGILRVEDFVATELSPELQRIGEAIRDSLEMVEFTGVSGPVVFEGGTRTANRLRVLQYRMANNSITNANVTLKDVASISLADNMTFQFIDSETITTVWPAGIPQDGTPIVTENFPVLPLTVVCYCFATASTFFAVGCMVFNFAFRQRKLIRLTSPNLNYIIGIGVIVFNTAVYFFVYPQVPHTALVVMCNIRSWFASLGYSLCFGTINAKMWRVYYICHNPKPSKMKKVLKDWHLFLFVMAFVLIDVIILTIVGAVDTARFHLEECEDREFPTTVNADGIKVNYVVTLCTSRWRSVWLGVLFGYKAIIQVIGVYLAFRIRKVAIKVLNDSKEIAATLYLSSGILAVVIIVSLAIPKYLNVYGACYAIGIPTATTVVLLVVFVSKMVRLYRDPKGENIFEKTYNGTTGMVATHDFEKVTTLEKKVKDLQSQLSVYESASPAHFGSTAHTNGKTATLGTISEDTENGDKLRGTNADGSRSHNGNSTNIRFDIK